MLSSPAVETVIKMVESVPESAQSLIVEHLREYIEEMRDELKWDEIVRQTQPQLRAAARKARQEIADGQAMPLNERML